MAGACYPERIGRGEVRNLGWSRHMEVLGCHNLKPADPMQLTAGSQERLVRVRTGAWTMLDIKHETSEMSYCWRGIKQGRKKESSNSEIQGLQGNKKKSCVGCMDALHLAKSNTFFTYQSEHFSLRTAALHPGWTTSPCCGATEILVPFPSQSFTGFVIAHLPSFDLCVSPSVGCKLHEGRGYVFVFDFSVGCSIKVTPRDWNVWWMNE